MSRLVVVSNRVALPPGQQAPGGLAVTLAATLRATGGLWFGWSGQVTAHAPVMHRHTTGEVDYATVDLSPAEYGDYYQGYCNGVLWPLCHGLPAMTPADEASFGAYRNTNARYAAHLQPLLQPDDLVWVHDYHLLPLGSYLRAMGSRHRIGFFLHVPCPPLETLEQGRELLRSLLAYDLLGFQTKADLQTFATTAASLWGVSALASAGYLLAEGRRVALAVFPVGIDVDAVRTAAQSLPPAQAAHWWPRGNAAPRLIGADRLDVSKGLPRRFEAYRAYLAARQGDAAVPDYLQLVTPSRSELPAHQLLQASLQEAQQTVNRAYAAAAGPSLRCAFTAVEHDTLMGLLAQADIALVTPYKDGMNLLAKEFVAAQPAANPGVLVLSTHAGAARELEAAILVDPCDVAAMAQAIATAVDMPLDERQARHAALLAALQRQEVLHWHTAFLQRLQERPPH